jgi:hypothetical protein
VELPDWLRRVHRQRLGYEVLQKKIVMSATYRQSSRLRPELADVIREPLLARGPQAASGGDP